MNKTLISSSQLPIFYIGIALLLSFFLLKSLSFTFLFIVPLFLGLALHKRLTILTILASVYTTFYVPTTLIWTNFKMFGVDANSSLNYIIYNPLGICIMVGCLTYIFSHRKCLITVMLRYNKPLVHIRMLLIEILLLSAILMFNYVYILFRGGHPLIAGYINLFVAPISLFVAIILGVIDNDFREHDLNSVLNALLILSFLLACFGICEFLQKDNFILSSLSTPESLEYYAPYYSMREDSPYRIFTLMGHPLTNASLFLAATLYSLVTKRIKVYLVVIFMIANLLTFSRASILLTSSLFLLFFFLKRPKAIGMRFLAILASCLLLTALYLSPLKHSVERRFISDDAHGSTMIRIGALAYVKNNLARNVPDMLLGKGAGKSLEISREHLISQGSFEIPWIIFAVDNGIFVTVIYLGILAHVLIALLAGIKRNYDISIVAFLVTLGVCIQLSSYNSIACPLSNMGYFLWFLLALSMGYQLTLPQK